MTQQNENEQHDEQSQRTALNNALAQGQAASELLGNPVYNLVYQESMRNLHAQWLGTEPKEEKKRESLYWQARGLINVTEQMGGLVERAQEIMRRGQDGENGQPGGNDDYLDMQGFGDSQAR
tara:strand:- start:7083 stop:7448 length:366 start_codon:yes stop_codon:yes gene_type:complete